MTDNAATSAAPSRTAILVAAFDSQLKWAPRFSGRWSREGSPLGDRQRHPHAISDGQLADYGGGAGLHALDPAFDRGAGGGRRRPGHPRAADSAILPRLVRRCGTTRARCHR